MLIKLDTNAVDELVKLQGLKLPFTIPTQAKAYPFVPIQQEANSSIKSNGNAGIIDDAIATTSDISVDKEGDDMILETIMDFAGVLSLGADFDREIYLELSDELNKYVGLINVVKFTGKILQYPHLST